MSRSDDFDNLLTEVRNTFTCADHPNYGSDMEAGSDDNAPYDFRKSFNEAGHKGPLSSDPAESPLLAVLK